MVDPDVSLDGIWTHNRLCWMPMLSGQWGGAFPTKWRQTYNSLSFITHAKYLMLSSAHSLALKTQGRLLSKDVPSFFPCLGDKRNLPKVEGLEWECQRQERVMRLRLRSWLPQRSSTPAKSSGKVLRITAIRVGGSPFLWQQLPGNPKTKCCTIIKKALSELQKCSNYKNQECHQVQAAWK